MMSPVTVDVLSSVEGAYLSGDGLLARIHQLRLQIDVENDGFDVFGILHKRDGAGCYLSQKTLTLCLVTEDGEIVVQGAEVIVDPFNEVTIMSVPGQTSLLYSVDGERVSRTLVLPL